MSGYDYELRAAIPRVLVEVVPGEELEITLPILDSTDVAVAVADADAWSALVQLRTQARSTDVLYTFTTAGLTPNASITAGSAGAVVLTASATDTAAWQAAWTSTPQGAVADVFVTDDDAEQHCLADLVFTLLPRTTRED
jgi:hypothetical protein